MTLIDALFLLAVVLIWPAYIAVIRYPRLMRAAGSGITKARITAYREGVITQWVLAAVGLVLWLTQPAPGMEVPRTLTDLGLGSPWGIGFGICLVLTAGLLMVLAAQHRSVLSDPEAQIQVRQQLTGISPLLPRTPHELRFFFVVSITAGVCEEILWRGYLMGTLTELMPVWAAVLVSGVSFGLAHAYQGKRGIIQTGIAGIVFGLLYWISGSLWIPMFVHATIDANSGDLAYRVLNNTEPPPFEGDPSV